MAIFILLVVAFLLFAFYRYRKYQKAREIEEMAADAQAYVSSEVVELLQRFKTIAALDTTSLNDQQKKVYTKIKNLTENLLCHTDSEASVREYLVTAKQEIVIIQRDLDELSTPHSRSVLQSFDDLK